MKNKHNFVKTKRPFGPENKLVRHSLSAYYKFIMYKSDSAIILAGILIICLSSCDHLYTYSYTLSNSADTSINVSVKTHLLDTVYFVASGETKLLYIVEHTGDSHGPDLIDVKDDLITFMVTKKGVSSQRDYLKNESWNFENGSFKTTVTNDEF